RNRICNRYILNAVGPKNDHITDVFFINFRRPGIVRVGSIAITDLMAADWFIGYGGGGLPIPGHYSVIMRFPKDLPHTKLQSALAPTLNVYPLRVSEYPVSLFIGG